MRFRTASPLTPHTHPITFLLTIPRRFLYYSSSLCVGVLHEPFVLLLFVPHICFCWYLGKAVLRDCGISWVSSLVSLSLLPHPHHNHYHNPSPDSVRSSLYLWQIMKCGITPAPLAWKMQHISAPHVSRTLYFRGKCMSLTLSWEQVKLIIKQCKRYAAVSQRSTQDLNDTGVISK